MSMLLLLGIPPKLIFEQGASQNSFNLPLRMWAFCRDMYLQHKRRVVLRDWTDCPDHFDSQKGSESVGGS